MGNEAGAFKGQKGNANLPKRRLSGPQKIVARGNHETEILRWGGRGGEGSEMRHKRAENRKERRGNSIKKKNQEGGTVW